MKILIFGAGAIGSAFGGFLSRSHDVTLLGRAPHLHAIRRHGLHVSGIWGRHVFRKFQYETEAKRLAVKRPTFDLILLTVKSFDTEGAARAIRRLLSPKTLVLPIQNGLGNVEILQRTLPKRQVLAGRVITGVVIPKPGHLRITVTANPKREWTPIRRPPRECRRQQSRTKLLENLPSKESPPASARLCTCFKKRGFPL